MNYHVWPPTLKRSCSCFRFYFFLLKKIWKKAHNMVSLMLDPRFKAFCLGSSFIGHEQGKAILKNMTKNLCFLCILNVFIICIHWLNFEKDVVEQRVEEDRSLDIFEMTTSTIEPVRNLVNRELLIFRHYQVDF